MPATIGDQFHEGRGEQVGSNQLGLTGDDLILAVQ